MNDGNRLVLRRCNEDYPKPVKHWNRAFLPSQNQVGVATVLMIVGGVVLFGPEGALILAF